MNARVRTMDLPAYELGERDDDLIKRALAVLAKRVQRGPLLGSPSDVRAYLQLEAEGLDYEVFGVMFLDSQNRLVTYQRMFTGTLTQTSVYPREVIKRALELGAASVVLHHNHPSGLLRPSRADEALTQTLKAALALVDVRCLDHIITSDEGACSMAELGMV